MTTTPATDQTTILSELIQLAETQLAESWAVTRDQNTYARRSAVCLQTSFEHSTKCPRRSALSASHC